MAGWMIPLSVLRRQTPPARVAWRTAVYRVGVDGGMFVGPLVSGFVGAGHLSGLAAVFAAALTIVGIVLFGNVAAPATRGRPSTAGPTSS
jgi:hypothetical protein